MSKTVRRPAALAFLLVGLLCGSVAGVVAFILTWSLVSAVVWYTLISAAITIMLLLWHGFRDLHSQRQDVLEASEHSDILGKIWIVSCPGSHSADELQTFAASLACPLGIVSTLDALPRCDAPPKSVPGFLFVDVDYLESLEFSLDDLVDVFRNLRRMHPGCAVILLSSAFGRDDSDIHRLEICDASIRIPVSQARLLEAARDASLNNISWCERQLKRHVI